MSEDAAVTPPPLKAILIPSSKDTSRSTDTATDDELATPIGQLWVPPITVRLFPHGEQGWEDLCKAINATYGETVEVDKRKMGADFSGSYWLWCDEEARVSSSRPQPNPMATSLAGSSYPILGDALLLNLNDQGDHVDVQDRVFEALQRVTDNMRNIIAQCAKGTNFSDTGDVW